MERRKRDSGGEGTTELGRQIERLQRDLTRRERELDEERRETERTIDRMRILEKDKIELKRELDEVRDEVTEYQRVVDELQQDHVKAKGQQKGEDEDDRLSSLRATLQERNREIGHFIHDLEKVEDEKESLKQKLAEVSGSLEEATAQLTELTKDRVDLRTKLGKTEDLVGRLEEEKSILQIRERELLDFKVRHDQQLENLGNAVDIRVDVWKKMMFQKDEEIERLHEKVEALINRPPSAQLNSEKEAIQRLRMKVKEREQQIRHLAEQLHEATQELNNNTKVIQNLQVELPHGGSGEETDRVLRSYEKKLRKLESKVEKRGLALGAAEKEAEEKTREIVVLSARLREYEAGQYGLSDAVAEIKDLKGQLRIRDRDLLKLTQEVNQFQIEGSELADENEMLRKKLGHSPQEDLSQERKIFTKKRAGELNALQTKLEVMENEITTLKTRNYELKKMLSAAQEQLQSAKGTSKEKESEKPEETTPPHHPRGEEPSLGMDSSEAWREKYDIILHENTELRKGLQEILDSFQRLSEDESCSVRIESPILENLLREMSARGLINYPYSISSFHLKVCNLEGKNSQLREELHRTRLWAEGLIEKEKQRCEEWREKAMAAQEIEKDGDGGGRDAEYKQRLKETQLETSRWRRIAEQSEKLNTMLNEKLEESDVRMSELEARLEEMPTEAAVLPRTPSLARVPGATTSIGIQTERADCPMTPEKDSSPTLAPIDFETRLRELENLLAAKDEVIENLQTFSSSYEPASYKPKSPVMSNPEIEEGLLLARETIQSLTERLRTKDENLNAYKRILAEVRGEMQLATERHVQDMNALQSTIHQQQQAFTRMKSTLSHPVRDTQTTDIEGIIREQLTRINELEECVRDLEHTMGNVASQLAAARSDAHRSRLTADTRLKEIDHLREQLGIGNPTDELESLQETIRVQEEKICELKRSNQTAAVLKELLDEKEMEIQALRATASTRHHPQKAHVPMPIPQPTDDRLAELERYRKTNQELQTKLAKLQVRLSKMNATNRASGMSQEMEELRKEYAEMVEQRDSYRAQVTDLEKHTHEEDEKKRRTVEGFARWDESKKWKKTVERLEEQKRKVEEERLRLSKQVDDLRTLLTRLEKEKSILDTRLKRGLKSSTSEQSLTGDGTTTEKLRQEIEGLRGILEQKEFHASESTERLTMEAQILRERIESQERQLTAYEVSNKGDPKVVAEIEKLVHSNTRLQQDLANQQQANLDLKLQIQEMKLETPRLRDRVQHLQKLIDTFKNDKSGTQRGPSGRSLGELEKTISALKSVVEKLEKEKGRPGSGVQLKGSKSGLRLRERQEKIIEEKQRLMEQIQEVEEERDNLLKLQVENEARIGDLLQQRDDAESRAQSAEMRLTTFLEEESIFSERMKVMEQEIERKTHLLAEAKKSIEEITKGKRANTKRV